MSEGWDGEQIIATVRRRRDRKEVDYPSGDGRPMAETPIHRQNMTDLIETLGRWFADDPMVYVTGSTFVYYVEGNRSKRLCPDVFVVRGVPRDKDRDYYLIWEEGRGPDVIIELTSPSTREEDLKDKYQLYQDDLRVAEYFLFDPRAEYLKPSLQGFRLRKERYQPIQPVRRRLPSEVLGLHLEREGTSLRLYDPARRRLLPTQRESEAQAEAARQQAEAAHREAEASLRQKEAENERLRRELEELRRRLEKGP